MRMFLDRERNLEETSGDMWNSTQTLTQALAWAKNLELWGNNASQCKRVMYQHTVLYIRDVFYFWSTFFVLDPIELTMMASGSLNRRNSGILISFSFKKGIECVWEWEENERSSPGPDVQGLCEDMWQVYTRRMGFQWWAGAEMHRIKMTYIDTQACLLSPRHLIQQTIFSFHSL